MSVLASRGCTVKGVEIDASCVQACQAAGLNAIEGRAECLPVSDASVDAIVCSVVLPYTDQRRAIAEWSRVLRPGGIVNVTCHGIGYGLDYLIRGPGLSRRLYGVRMLLNTQVYQLLGRRLPGWLGDTLCQQSRALNNCYRASGLTLVREEVVGAVMGLPRYLCHRVVKR